MDHKKSALITGGSGYFAESLVKKLIGQGFKCSILDINKPSKDIIEKVTYYQVDIRDRDRVFNACKNIEYIFHNVAQVPLAKDKELFDSVNIYGTKNIIQAGLQHNCKHLVYTSSSAIFGVPDTNPVDETTIPRPQEAYGEAKLKGEQACIESRNQGMQISIVRPRTILGHGRLGIFQILFEWIYEGKKVPVFDKGDNLYQFIHTDDLAEACILAAIKGGDETYNIGASNFNTMRGTLESLIKYAKTNSSIRSVPSTLIVPLMKLSSFLRLSPLGPYHALMYGKSMYFDITKAQQELGWEPKYSNEEMIIESYEYYIQNREQILNENLRKSPHKSAIKQGVLSLIGRFL